MIDNDDGTAVVSVRKLRELLRDLHPDDQIVFRELSAPVVSYGAVVRFIQLVDERIEPAHVA